MFCCKNIPNGVCNSQESQMASEHDKARGEESRKTHFLKENQKAWKTSIVLLIGIMMMVGAIGLQNHINTDFVAKSYRDQIRAYENDEKSRQARYKDVMSKLKDLEKKLDDTKNNCANHDAPENTTSQPTQ